MQRTAFAQRSFFIFAFGVIFALLHFCPSLSSFFLSVGGTRDRDMENTKANSEAYFPPGMAQIGRIHAD